MRNKRPIFTICMRVGGNRFISRFAGNDKNNKAGGEDNKNIIFMSVVSLIKDKVWSHQI